MHFQNARCPNFPVATVEGFQKLRQRVRASNESEIEIKKDKLPTEAETVILKPAL